jgi:hypothetical protein
MSVMYGGRWPPMPTNFFGVLTLETPIAQPGRKEKKESRSPLQLQELGRRRRRMRPRCRSTPSRSTMSQDTPVTTAIGLLGGDDDDSGGGVAQDWTPATRVEAVGPHGKIAMAQQTCVGLQEQQQTAPPSMLTARHASWRGR